MQFVVALSKYAVPHNSKQRNPSRGNDRQEGKGWERQETVRAGEKGKAGKGKW
jgi:hypothetical protein